MALRVFNKLSIKLFFVISAVLVVIFSIYTYIIVVNLQENITSLYRQTAYNMSDIIKRSTRYSMFYNKRDDIREIVRTIGNEPGVKSVRIYNKTGVIVYSADDSELNKKVDINAEACNVCHRSNESFSEAILKDSIRIFKVKNERFLGLINPIKNEKDCYTSDCHAHSESSKYLGVLDVVISMQNADAVIGSTKRTIIVDSVLLTITISAIAGLFFYVVVNKPLRKLQKGIDELGRGNLDYRIEVNSRNELGIIASEFNEMARKLSIAYNEIKQWSEKLNEKVEEKTEELKRVYSQIVQIEKLASLGKLSATVAHELNNPLEGILTYSRLLSRKVKSIMPEEKQVIEILDLIGDESARCGKIVKDLLLFSHREEDRFSNCNIIDLVDKAALLIKHHFEINNITLVKQYDVDNLEIRCNSQKIEQALISLMINAIEAMGGREGKIIVRVSKEDEACVVRVIDEGCGIAEKDINNIFEPFYTTKANSKAIGLGLAVVYGIIQSHKGKIVVENTSPKGTTFKITLPLNQKFEKNEKQNISS